MMEMNTRGVEESGQIFILNGDSFKIFGFEDLVAIEAADVIDPVAPCHDLGAGMLTNLHRNQNDIPLF